VDWPNNDSLRATNQYFINIAFNQKKRDVAQATAELDKSVSDWLAQPGQVQRPDFDVWSKLGPDERTTVDKALIKNLGFGLGNIQPKVDYPGPALPVISDKDYSAALNECRISCSEKFEDRLFLGWAGIPASDQSAMMQVCIRDCMQGKGLVY
jgi:hypothetical protein